MVFVSSWDKKKCYWNLLSVVQSPRYDIAAPDQMVIPIYELPCSPRNLHRMTLAAAVTCTSFGTWKFHTFQNFGKYTEPRGCREGHSGQKGVPNANTNQWTKSVLKLHLLKQLWLLLYPQMLSNHMAQILNAGFIALWTVVWIQSELQTFST